MLRDVEVGKGGLEKGKDWRLSEGLTAHEGLGGWYGTFLKRRIGQLVFFGRRRKRRQWEHDLSRSLG